MRQNLISEIKAFLQETGLSAYRFGYLAVRNGRLVERLEAGRRIWPETETEVRAFILSERRRRDQIDNHDRSISVPGRQSKTLRASESCRPIDVVTEGFAAQAPMGLVSSDNNSSIVDAKTEIKQNLGISDGGVRNV